MDIKPIRTEADYDWALVEIARYFDDEPLPGTRDADRFDILADLITAYEARTWPVDAPDPVEAIHAVMTMRGLGQTDLSVVLGSRARASEILSRRRRLTLEMIHKLSAAWHIPAEVLIRPYALARSDG